MKSCILNIFMAALTVGAFALGQSATTTYTADYMNGGFAASATTTSSDHSQTQVGQSLNGAKVPLEQRQERILSKAADGTVTTEIIVRRYDPTGEFATTERTIEEQRPTLGGGSVVTATTYRTDVNGQEQRAEKRVVETQVAGSTTTVNTVIDRAGMDGSFQTAEKRSAITKVDQSSPANKSSTTTESVYRGDPSGGFVEAERKVTTETQSPKGTVVDTTTFHPGSNAGALELQEQRIATSSTAPDGSQTTRIDVYAPAADGYIAEGGKPQLKQQQIITHEKAADGSVIEVLSVREPTVSDPNLGAPRVISKTVCTGKCEAASSEPPAAAPTAPPAKP